ncbi:hypothetical protein C5167_018449 [Papaver somniferum]|uniref:UDP N-acetylglucosamine O-acyltransferase C-terminal domain-containing protein n=1 Tax=Papaver somniferum TaxID=3469 RepID=A0A4Y7IQN4_PAPSO|nr:hypothetical protein C5167_018449 [Papaver somniferum]
MFLGREVALKKFHLKPSLVLLHPANAVIDQLFAAARGVIVCFQTVSGSGAIVGEDIPGRTTIGCNNIIGHHVVVGVKCQHMKYKPGSDCFLDVGENNEIREYTSIHRSSKSSDRKVIDDNNLIMGSCHIAHDCKLGNNVVFANNALIAGHVVVEEQTKDLAMLNVVCSMVQSIRDSFGQDRRGICKFRHWSGS